MVILGPLCNSVQIFDLKNITLAQAQKLYTLFTVTVDTVTDEKFREEIKQLKMNKSIEKQTSRTNTLKTNLHHTFLDIKMAFDRIGKRT